MKNVTTLLMLFVLLIITSCSDDSTSVSTPDNLINFSKGNYWIFDTYSVDKDLNRTGQKYRDSIVAETNETFQGKDSWFFVRYRDKANYDTLILSVEETKVYRYLRPHEIDLPGFSAQWISFAELTDTWFVTRSDVLIDVEYENFTDTSTANYIVNGYNDGQDTVLLFEDNNAIGTKFRIKNDMSVSFSKPNSTCDFKLTRAKQTTYSLSKETGIIRIIKHPYLKKVTSYCDEIPGKEEWTDGEVSEIMGYHVNF